MRFSRFGRSRRPILFVFAGLLFVSAGSARAADRRFDTWWGFDTGSYPEAFWAYVGQTGDLNADGYPDVVAANHWFPNKVSVLLSTGHGDYVPSVQYTIGASSRGVILADFDRDGDVDIAAANTGSNYQGTTVTLLRNSGSGSFPDRRDFTAVTGPTGLAAADFNGDGWTDLAVTSYEEHGLTDRIALLVNDASGGFLAPALFPAGAGPHRLAAGDLNGDGRIDLAVARLQRKVSVLINTGGAFAAPVTYQRSDTPWSTDSSPDVELADLDHDGDLDVFSTSTGTATAGTDGLVAVFMNQGNGTLGPRLQFVVPVYIGGAMDLRVADATGDGWVDMMTSHGDGAGWVFFRSSGAGRFEAPVEITGGDDPAMIDVADADRDGDQDVFVINAYQMSAMIHLNDGTGHFREPAAYDTEPLSGQMDAGDIDADGDLDVATCYAYAGGGGVSVLRNTGNGAFGPRTNYVGPRGAMAVKLRDLDRDGDLDLVWANDHTSPPYDFVTRLNNGSGGFGPAAVWPVGTCGTGDLQAADVDNDGDLDVLLTDWLGCTSYDSPWVHVCLNNGNATFQPPYQLAYLLDPNGLACADLDDDGSIDLVTSHSDGLRVVRGHGDGTFTAPIRLNVPWGTTGIVLADLDGDTHLDIATADDGGDDQSSVSVLIGDGAGGFLPAVSYRGTSTADQTGPVDMETGDADGDGDLDLMVPNWAPNDFGYFENLGAGVMAPMVRYGLGPVPSDLVFADFDRDGVGDVAAVIGVPPSNLSRRLVVVKGLPLAATSVAATTPVTGGAVVMAAHPNPFGSATTLTLGLAHEARVRLTLHDVTGRLVTVLVDGVMSSGAHRINWNGRNLRGEPVAGGVYFARVESGASSGTTRLILAR